MTMLTTPAGHVVSTAEPLTPEWYAVRREGITATDLPQILGLSKYGNALSVWRDKRGERSDGGDSEWAFWGRKHEPTVAEVWADQEKTTVSPVGIIANNNLPWIRASLDRLVGICPDGLGTHLCGLEIKTRDAFVAGKWREEIPDDVLAQVEWGLMATGFAHMHVAVLIGGNRLRTYTVQRDEALDRYLLGAARPVWTAVENGTPPEVHPDAEGVLLAELNNMFRKREGAVHVEIGEARAHLEAYRSGHRFQKDGERIKTVAKTALVQLLGEAEVALGPNDEALYTYKKLPDEEVGDELTAANLARLKTDCPELYADLVAQGYITKQANNPTFRIK